MDEFMNLFSLLRGNRKQSKKQNLLRLLGLTGIKTLFNIGQQKVRNDYTKALSNTNDAYQNVFQDNKEYFNSTEIKRQRELFRLYENPETRERALLTKAKNYFNSSPEMIKKYGDNPYNVVVNTPKTTEGQNSFMEEMELLKELAKKSFESTTDEAILSETFTQYNKKAADAYKAAIKAEENNPRNKSLIRRAWVDNFGTDKKGNPRFGNVYYNELLNLKEDADALANIGPNGLVDRSEIIQANNFALPKIEDNFGLLLKKSDSNAISSHRQLFNNFIDVDKYQTEIGGDEKYSVFVNGREKKQTFYRIYKNLDNDEKMKMVSTVLTYSKADAEEFNKNPDNIGQVRPANYFLLPAIEKAVQDLNSGMLTKMDNVFDPNKVISIQYPEQAVTETKLGAIQEIFTKTILPQGEEAAEEFIINTERAILEKDDSTDMFIKFLRGILESDLKRRTRAPVRTGRTNK
tara:strand:- start:5075 stop:6463 length:1389 start_codon:yes stop_codon:yes gene_type:complete